MMTDFFTVIYLLHLLRVPFYHTPLHIVQYSITIYLLPDSIIIIVDDNDILLATLLLVIVQFVGVILEETFPLVHLPLRCRFTP